MRYRVTKNGENIIITNSLRHASEAYNKCIYTGKSGDIIRAYFRKSPNDKWEQIRKDWL